MIQYSEAREIIERECVSIPRRISEVPLLDALGRVTAVEVRADIEMPSFDHSAVDGFAVHLSQHERRTIIGEITAGNFRDFSLSDTTAVSIMTGGKIPNNTDAVIPMEDVRVDGDDLMLLPGRTIKKGMNIRCAGGDMKQYSMALPAHTRIQSKNISLLAACGKARVTTIEQLSVGVLSTGDELVEISENPKSDKIRATNRYALLAAVKQYGQLPVDFGIVSDSKDILRNTLSKILQEDTVDILLTTGGVSVGKHDHMQEIWKELGVTIHFWRVNIKPGKPLLFGTFERSGKKIILLGLPGNPVSAFVNFEIFIKPSIEKFYFQNTSHPISAKVVHDIQKKDAKRHFLCGRMNYQYDQRIYEVDTIDNRSSGNMAGLSDANCLLVLDEERGNVQKGEWVECIQI